MAFFGGGRCTHTTGLYLYLERSSSQKYIGSPPSIHRFPLFLSAPKNSHEKREEENNSFFFGSLLVEVTYASFSLLSSSCSFAALLNAYIYSPHDPSPLPPPFSLPFSIQSLSGRVATKPARGGKLRSSVRFGKVKRKSTHSLLLSYMQEEHPPRKSGRRRRKWAA